MIETLQEVGIEGTFLKIMKDTYNKAPANVIHSKRETPYRQNNRWQEVVISDKCRGPVHFSQISSVLNLYISLH